MRAIPFRGPYGSISFMTRPAPSAPGSLAALLALATLVPPATSLHAQEPLSPEHDAIAFLVGEWRTASEFPDGRVGDGELEYRWVLDGAWMKVEFRGEHPDGLLWEAHVLQRWDPGAGAYEAWSFPAGGPPVRRTGTLVGPGHYRLEHRTEEGVVVGIDYHRREDGTVYQENWIEEDGELRITLRTRYRPR